MIWFLFRIKAPPIGSTEQEADPETIEVRFREEAIFVDPARVLAETDLRKFRKSISESSGAYLPSVRLAISQPSSRPQRNEFLPWKNGFEDSDLTRIEGNLETAP